MTTSAEPGTSKTYASDTDSNDANKTTPLVFKRTVQSIARI